VSGNEQHGRPAVETVPDEDPAVDNAIRWVVDALLEGEIEQTAAFFRLEPSSQIVALQCLRTSARAALTLAELDQVEFVAAVAGSHRRWLG
jgi:hypothetical protein